ncbi:MAG: hypothetical protein ACE5ID_09245, partial [Acidobacteriota bacterium]
MPHSVMDPSLQSVLPPLLALTLAFWSRKIAVALLCGIWAGTLLLTSGQPMAGTVSAVRTTLEVALEPSNARLLIFCLLIGPLVVFL